MAASKSLLVGTRFNLVSSVAVRRSAIMCGTT
jgi:hypothetical protein